MQRISSATTFVFKRVFPVFWFGFLAVFLALGLFGARPPEGPALLPFVLMPVIMAVFGYLLMSKLVFDLVDEVLDAGDALVVRNRGDELRVPLADIANVSQTMLMNPQRVTLRLRTPGRFGREISFVPQRAGFMPWSRNKTIDDLIDRIDAKRMERR